MKNNVSKVLAVALTVLLAAALLVSCSSKYKTLENAFVKAGYAVNEDFTALADSIKSKLEKEEYAVEMHMLTKTGPITSVLIIEFRTTKELVDAYRDNENIRDLVRAAAEDEDVQKAYAKLVEKGFAKGNCLVVPLSIFYIDEITEIVKNA